MTTPSSDIGFRPIEDEMEQSYIDYAMSVIVGRALPDLRDGLKPVQRRILFAMYQMGLRPNQPHRKCARVVGEVLGRYHPHGESAVYDALVRMGQSFSLRYPLIDGQGNFGSLDGDPPAATRYTECRLAPPAEEILQDIDKDTVDFVGNFDASVQEPLLLPGKLPNLLVNGASGIAVGMSTNIPPHNLQEVCDALIHVIDNPDAKLRDVYDPVEGPIRGPDFPTGGQVCGTTGITEAYKTGRGLLRVRAAHKVEPLPRDKKAIIITEIPYQVNKASLVEAIADLVKQKKVDGIVDLRDESDQRGIRVVVELRRDIHEEIVLNQLYAHTPLQSTYGVITIALVDNQPRTLSLVEVLREFLDFREEVVRRRTTFELRKAEERIHVVQGLLAALDRLDDVIGLIRESENVDDARVALEAELDLTEVQAKAILDMRLARLTALEARSLREERRDLAVRIEELRGVLEDRNQRMSLIREELLDLKQRYGDERRTSIEVEEPSELQMEDLVPNEAIVITVSNTGYVKRQPLKDYRVQDRAGKGKIGVQPKEEDFVLTSFVASAHDNILLFTNLGRCHWLRGFDIPETGPYAKGKPVVNLLPRLESNERVQAVVPASQLEAGRFVVIATEKGFVERVELQAFSNPRSTGVQAIDLRHGDNVVEVRLSSGEKDIFLATRKGWCLRIPETWIGPTGRGSKGAKAVKLEDDDSVIAMQAGQEPGFLLTVTEKGLGKLTDFEEYSHPRKFHPMKGCRPLRTLKTTTRTGDAVAVRAVNGDEEILISTRQGKVIRTEVDQIRETRRIAQGVKLVSLDSGDAVASVSVVSPDLVEG